MEIDEDAALSQRAHEGCLHLGPASEDLPGARPHRVQPDSSDREISSSIFFERAAVVLVTVNLHGHRALEHEVDPLEAVGVRDLRPDLNTGSSQSRARETLRQGVAVVDAHVNQPTTGPQPFAQLSEFDAIEPARATHPVEHGNGLLGGLGAADELERLSEIDDARRGISIMRRADPVHDDAVIASIRPAKIASPLVAQTSRVGRHRHVQRMSAEHPPAERGDRADAGQPTANAHRPEPRISLRPRRVPASSGPVERAGLERSAQIVVGGAELLQPAPVECAAVTGDDVGSIHRRRVAQCRAARA